MKIDLPITILFNCSDLTRQHQAASARVCTVRFDTEDNSIPAELFDHYPPSERAVAANLGEPGDGVLAMLSSRAYDAIKKAAARSPYDYMVGTEQERTIAQEQADEEAAQDGQFGAGA